MPPWFAIELISLLLIKANLGSEVWAPRSLWPTNKKNLKDALMSPDASVFGSGNVNPKPSLIYSCDRSKQLK